MAREREFSENELVKGCIENSRLWQERLYKTYFDSMYLYCYKRVPDEEMCISIVNNGFLKVFKNIQSYKHIGSLDGWIRKIVYNCLIDEIRANKKHRMTDELQDHFAESDQIMEMFFETDLKNLMSELPESTGRVFNLFAVEGYTHEEISGRLNISVGTSKWHVSNARVLLKQMIEKNYER
ncbi:MAG: sigma-70 family RNA polymerase sigma factor [Saprospiraceae bacterium]|nr:sigma-70 family RNA polymerase sigma factor [Saprospiraceae bacterium]